MDLLFSTQKRLNFVSLPWEAAPYEATSFQEISESNLLCFLTSFKN
jgi:hypothetical protein